MIDTKVQEELSKFKVSRETFKIIDENWLGNMDVMILGIKHYEDKDDLIKVIDMWDFSEDFDVCDYEISLTALIKARKKFLDEEQKTIDRIFPNMKK